MKKVSFSLVLSIFFSLSFSSTEAWFRFMDDNNIPLWASNSVETLRENDIMTGFGDGTFKPDKKLNRAEAVTLLMRLKEITPSEGISQTSFSDVPRNVWFTSAVIEATNRGWIKGFPDGKFYPEKNLNRAEWATLISRAFDLTQEAPNAEYKDVPSQAWFARPIFALAENELIRETGNHFQPDQPVSRADAAWILAKIYDMPRFKSHSWMSSESTHRNGSVSRETTFASSSSSSPH